MHLIKTTSFLLLLLILLVSSSYAQHKPKPQGAFIRSLIVPGWGHYYTNHNQWTRGQIHLGTEVALIVSYFGFASRAENMETQYVTLASLKAGVDISDRNRAFRIAMGDFNTLREYNDFQLRSRNWNRIFDDQSRNNWSWENEEARNHYNNLRSDVDRVRNQLPALIGLMVANRVLSAVNAYNRAKNQAEIPEISFSPVQTRSNNFGIVGTMNIRF